MKNFHYLCTLKTDAMPKINRLKMLLRERNLTNRWLSSQLDVDPTTVSKWCTNSSQPDILTLLRIARLLDVEVKDLYDQEIVRAYSTCAE